MTLQSAAFVNMLANDVVAVWPAMFDGQQLTRGRTKNGNETHLETTNGNTAYTTDRQVSVE